MNTLALYRIIKAGWHNFQRNGWLSLATVSVMFLAIFSMGSLLLTNVVLQNILTNLQSKVDVSVYLKAGISQQEITQIRADLAAMGEVKNVTYVSADQALDSFKAKHSDNPTLIESLNELGNPLLPALNIEAEAASQYDGIINFLQNGKYQDDIEKINYQENRSLIERLSSFSNNIRRSGIILSIILAVIAGLVTFNTIRLAMYNFREEIGVKRLVGASDWYIRGPFIVEGMIYGAIAAVATIILFLPILYFISPKISAFVPESDIFGWFKSNLVGMFILQMLIGMVLGVASSFVAIRKYLKV
jgi:cell division transport system permease protein